MKTAVVTNTENLETVSQDLAIQLGLEHLFVEDVLNQVNNSKAGFASYVGYKDDNNVEHWFTVCDEYELENVMVARFRDMEYENVPLHILKSAICQYSSYAVQQIMSAAESNIITCLSELFAQDEDRIAREYIENVGVENHFAQSYKFNFKNRDIYILG